MLSIRINGRTGIDPVIPAYGMVEEGRRRKGAGRRHMVWTKKERDAGRRHGMEEENGMQKEEKKKNCVYFFELSKQC